MAEITLARTFLRLMTSLWSSMSCKTTFTRPSSQISKLNLKHTLNDYTVATNLKKNKAIWKTFWKRVEFGVMHISTTHFEKDVFQSTIIYGPYYRLSTFEKKKVWIGWPSKNVHIWQIHVNSLTLVTYFICNTM